MDDQANIINTFTELAPRYEEVVDSELSFLWGWGYEKFISTFLENIPINDGDKVLDVATGTGEIPLNLKQKGIPQNHIHGLDITHSMLERAKIRLTGNPEPCTVRLVCASAMQMPYSSQSFQVVTCALATHHMAAEKLIHEMFRVLQFGGTVSIVDVGASKLWKIPGVKMIIRITAFVLFLFRESLNRAWAEARAVSKIRSIEEWNEILLNIGFREIKFTRLKSKHFWIPEPHIISAKKIHAGEKNDQNE